MPPKRIRAARVSPLFASLGPTGMLVRRHVTGTLGLSGEEANEAEREIHREHELWRDEHLAGWQAGEVGVPDPPYADVLDVFAKIA
jgi:hypothetical protein